MARRGYRFYAGRIARASGRVRKIATSHGPLDFEWRHLRAKLRRRDHIWQRRLGARARPEPHPLIRVTVGSVQPCEGA